MSQTSTPAICQGQRPFGANASILALFFLVENLTYLAWCGILITVLGVAWVISERTQATQLKKDNLKLGIFWGLMAGASRFYFFKTLAPPDYLSS